MNTKLLASIGALAMVGAPAALKIPSAIGPSSTVGVVGIVEASTSEDQARAAFPAVSNAAGRENGIVRRTPWGDPDLQGTYTNTAESGIPMERPAEFAGRRVEDVTPAELAKLSADRRARAAKTAITIGGTEDNDTGAGPSHWYENYNAANSRAWMISDPVDGKIPASTDAA